MKEDNIDEMLNSMDLPDPENIKHQQELKIPLLSYKRSSRAGLWLLVVPVIFALTFILKYQFRIFSPILDAVTGFYKIIEENTILTYLIPVIVIGLPLAAMVINLLSFFHFLYEKERNELIITIKYRPVNIGIFLFCLALLIYFFSPDALP